MPEEIRRERHKVTGEKLLQRVKQLVHEGNICRIIIKDEQERTIVEIPLTVGVVGALLVPALVTIGAIAALAADLTIEVEKVEPTAGAKLGPPATLRGTALTCRSGPQPWKPMRTLISLLIVGLVAAGCVDPNAANPTVQVLDDRFNPATVTIAAGATVNWTWNGMNAHNVVFEAAAGGPNSGVQTTGAFDRTFPTAGTYNYSCTLHAGMNGSVIVG